jgi:transposase-like protein
MLPLRIKTRYENRCNAPKHAPCPSCGSPGVRKQKLTRTVRSLAYPCVLLVRVTTAEYRATCRCCATFRTQVDGIEPKAQYTNAVREAVLDRLLDDHLSLEGIQAALRRDFLLDLSTGFVYDCLRWKARQLDLAPYRRWTLEQFSGTLCIDEIHLGRYALLLATDPLGDFPVAFALVSRNDQDHLARFLRQLRDHGLHPRVVVSDGSGLYPTVLADVWPQAEHQLCVLHVLQDLNRAVLAVVHRLRKHLARRDGQQRGRRGRPAKDRPDVWARRRRQRRDEARFVYRHRYLIVRRRRSLSARERQELAQLLDYLPALRRLRQFMDRVHQALERAQTPAQAWQRFEDLKAEAAFAADADLAALLAEWTPEQFAKMVAFLHSPLGARVRTNNHVERVNRRLRRYEKVRYRWRRARSSVRFVALAVDRLWRARQAGPVPRLFPPAGGGGGRAAPPSPDAEAPDPQSPPAHAPAA